MGRVRGSVGGTDAIRVGRKAISGIEGALDSYTVSDDSLEA